MPLSHSSPDCTGRWGVRTISDRSYWKCDVCLAIGYATIRNHEAAVLETIMGNTLDQLTKEGRKMLEDA